MKPRYIWDAKRRTYHLPNGPYKTPYWSLCGDVRTRGPGAHLEAGVVQSEEEPEPMCPKCVTKGASC